MRLIFDAHLDLAMNAMEWNRDLPGRSKSCGVARKACATSQTGDTNTISFPEMRRAGIGLCVATQLARVEHNAYSPIFGWRSRRKHGQ
jgi:membrane dipeptidase